MASGKKPNQHISAGDETGIATTRISTFDDTHVLAQNAALELFVKKLKSKTEGCEVSTGLAIWSAQPTEKLKALDAGIDEWEQALCSSANEYYDTCFELGRRNKTDLGGKLPAEFAYGLTAAALATFLRVSALDGEEEKHDGRVRQFIRLVCGPPEVDVDNLPDLSLDPAPSQAFLMPWWANKYSFGDRLAGKPKPLAMGTLSAEQSEKIILAKERKATAELLDALADARRQALIATGMSTSSSTKHEPLIAPTQNAAPPHARELQEQAAQAPTQQSPTQEEVQKRRACDIVQVQREIAEIRAQISRDDDYDRLKVAHREFILFRVCDRDPEMKELLLGIQGHHQKKALRFAKQVAASYNGIKLNTIEKAWDKYNPDKKSARPRITTPPRSEKSPRRKPHK